MDSIPVVDMEATGKKIETLIKAKGMTIKDLQEVLGFSTPQAIYNWIWGTSIPSIDSLVIISKVLSTKIDDIIVIK